jgi:hypothetical protein
MPNNYSIYCATSTTNTIQLWSWFDSMYLLTSHIITLLSAADEANTVAKFGFHST